MSTTDPRHADYDRIADLWRRDRLTGGFRERGLVERFLAPLPGGASVLDLGCGCGEPIGRALAAAGCEVVGVDASARLLAHARGAVPSARFVRGDLRTVELDRLFDGIVAWDCVFHLPRAEHPALFARMARWLRPAGRLLLSLGGSGHPGFTSRMHGATFFYSGHPPAEALRLLERAGFAIEHWEVDDPSSRGHVAVLAVRTG